MEGERVISDANCNVASTVVVSKDGFESLLSCERGRNVYWTTDVNVELPIKMSVGGLA